MLLTFVLAALGWILFRSQSIGEAIDFSIPRRTLVFVLILMVVEWLQRNREHGLSMEGVRSGVIRYTCYIAVLAVVFMFGVFNETFIYFQF